MAMTPAKRREARELRERIAWHYEKSESSPEDKEQAGLLALALRINVTLILEALERLAEGE